MYCSAFSSLWAAAKQLSASLRRGGDVHCSCKCGCQLHFVHSTSGKHVASSRTVTYQLSCTRHIDNSVAPKVVIVERVTNVSLHEQMNARVFVSSCWPYPFY
jgi:hypothetical protein